MGAGIYQRIFRAIGAEALGQFLNIGIRLVLVPLFLTTWGAQAYGEWLILTAAAAWFGLGDFGGQLYFINRMTAAWSAGRRDEFQRLMSSGQLLFLIASSLLLTVVIICLKWTQFLSWVGLQEVQQDVAMLVILLMILRFIVGFPLGLLLGVYRAIGAQATSVMYRNLMLVIELAGSAVLLLAGAGMLVLATMQVIPALLVGAIVIWHQSRVLPDIKSWALRKADRHTIREAISPSLHFLSIQLSMVVVIQGSIIAVAKALGPVDVAVFSVMRSLSNVMFVFMGILSHSAWPEFTRLVNMRDIKKFSHIFKTILLINLLCGVTYLVVIRNIGEELYGWWLNNKLPYDPTFMFLMSCFVILTILWTLGGNILMATNRHIIYSRILLPVNILAVLLCYWGAVEHGLTGSVIGLMVGQTILMTLTIILIIGFREHWIENATNLFRATFVTIILFPMCLNLWSGLLAIVLIALMNYRHFRWRIFPTIKARV